MWAKKQGTKLIIKTKIRELQICTLYLRELICTLKSSVEKIRENGVNEIYACNIMNIIKSSIFLNCVSSLQSTMNHEFLSCFRIDERQKRNKNTGNTNTPVLRICLCKIKYRVFAGSVMRRRIVIRSNANNHSILFKNF